MSDDSIDRVFEKAIVTIQTLSTQRSYHSLPKPPANIRIQLYAYFKQATEGDVKQILNKPEGNPTSQDYNLALRKWEAWKSKEGLSTTEAKTAYIELLIHTMKTYAMGTIVARELLSELEYMWWQVSHLNTFEGPEGTDDFEDASNSVLMLTNDSVSKSKDSDNESEKIRKEVYETLITLRQFSIQDSSKNNPMDRPSQSDSNIFKLIWVKIKTPVKLILIYSKKTAGFVGKHILSYSVLSFILLLILKHWNVSVDLRLDKRNQSSDSSRIERTLLFINQLCGINRIYLQIY